MTDAVQTLASPLTPRPLTWRGVLSLGLLALAPLGPLTASPSGPDCDHYIMPVVVLALGVGMGLSAARSPRRGDRVIGVAVIVVGLLLVTIIAMDSLSVIRK